MLQSYHIWTVHFIGHSSVTLDCTTAKHQPELNFCPNTPLHQDGGLIEVNEEAVFFDAALFDGLYGALFIDFMTS